jgi:hypothetical protein
LEVAGLARRLIGFDGTDEASDEAGRGEARLQHSIDLSCVTHSRPLREQQLSLNLLRGTLGDPEEKAELLS